MHFNLAKFLYNSIFKFAFFSVRYLLGLGFAPIRVTGKLSYWILGTGLALTVKPGTRALKNALFPAPKPKSYIKVGKPAVPPVGLKAQITSPVVISSSFAHQKTQHERTREQQELFLRRFAGVVQYGA
jgi:hypothetical protein